MEGLLYAYLLDGRGGARPLPEDEWQAWTPERGVLWIHLDYTNAVARQWIYEQSGLDSLVAEALLTEDTRPRATAMGDGLLIALRGVNLNPGAAPDDMVSIRLWAERDRIITTRMRTLLSIEDLRQQLERGTGPLNTADFLVELADRIALRMSDTVDNFENRMDELEDGLIEAPASETRASLATLRRQIITLRRYLAPQREAYSQLIVSRIGWLDEADRMRMHEASDRLTRHIEDFDAVRERAMLAHEELLSRLSDQLNKRMYILSIIAAIFLPLGFLTGLLGINVGGIPGAEDSHAFEVFLVILAGVVIAQIVLFKWKKWL